MKSLSHVMIPGGGGYVGSALVPALLEAGHMVSVLDLFMYGAPEDVFGSWSQHPNLKIYRGDVRDITLVKKAMSGCNKVIHLACISNDPSFELDPALGKSINFDCFQPLVAQAAMQGIERFIYASSSSVYGIKSEEEVTEDLQLEPLTDYSKFKAMCEEVLLAHQDSSMVKVIIRPATVCGFAPRQRLDVIVNILTNHAVNKRAIRIFGGSQKRPNIHIKDMVRAYLAVLEADANIVDGKVYNVGYENHTLDQLGSIVKKVVGEDIAVEHVSTDDLRSYHVSSDKIANEIGFVPEFTIEDAVRDLASAIVKGQLPDSLSASRYFNIKRMQELELS